MRQMSLIEMGGFLRGKCIPSDLKVNETNAEYPIRRFGELESELETASRKCSSAGTTIDNLEAKCTRTATENTSLKQSKKEFNDFCREEFSEWENNAIGTPATDASLAKVRAQGVDAAMGTARSLMAQEYEYKGFKATQNDCCMHPGSDLVGKVEITEWLVDFATQLCKGGNQWLYVLLINVNVGNKYHLLKCRITRGFAYLISMVWIRWLTLVTTAIPQQLLRRKQRKWLL